jgi:dTDP-4-amino-4,6-dideoxygalactose transaminase
MIRLVVPEIGEEEIQAVVAVLRSGHLVQGEYVQEFEQSEHMPCGDCSIGRDYGR